MTLSPGDAAPAFELPDQDGNVVSLADFHGRTLVLYFYPRDLTPGCTTEACQFNDALGGFAEKDAAVVGISADTAASHGRFRAKHGLTFPLLVDEGAEVAKAYGAYGEKRFMGRTSIGIKRSTFVIGPDGTIRKAFYKVSANGHAAAVLGDL
jgi:thioredoxin-dependent peroxiredoxin